MAHRRIGRLAVLALLATAGCGVRADGPPPIEVDRTGCAHCGMLVSETVYASAYRGEGAEPRVFDDIGCMAAELRHVPAADRRVWVHDFETGEWIDAERAVYVHSPSIKTPMGGGFIAFRARAAADRVAADKQGRVLPTLADVLAFGKDGTQ